MPASLPQSFYQTCTRPLPTLGQSEACETCRHRFHEVSIKHARCLFPHWAEAKHAIHASIASRPFLSNMLRASSHVGPKRNMPASLPLSIYQTCRSRPASLPHSIYQMCTRSLPTTLSQSDQTIHR